MNMRARKQCCHGLESYPQVSVIVRTMLAPRPRPLRTPRDRFIRYVSTWLWKRNVPLIAIQMMIMIWCAGLLPETATGTGVEYFSGDEAVSNGMRMHGFNMFSFDIRRNPNHDMLSDAGFISALILVMCVMPGGFAWLAPVCSSWIWLCRGRTGRNPARPEGRNTKFVRRGNAICARSILIAACLVARDCMVVIEQPMQSVMPYFRRFAWWIGTYRIFKTRSDLGIPT